MASPFDPGMSMRFGPKDPVSRDVVIRIAMMMVVQAMAMVALLGWVLEGVNTR